MKRVLLTVLCFTTAACLSTAGAPAQERIPDHYLREHGVARVEAFGANLSALTQAAADQQITGKLSADFSQGMKLDLFPDVSFVVYLNHVEQQSRNTFAWFGSVEGAPYGHATFVVSGNSIIGSVTTANGKIYQIRTDADGTRWVLEIDQSSFPDESDPISMPSDALDKSVADEHLAVSYEDDGSTIDVMVLYTSAARQAAGGITGMQQLVQLGIAETNQGYASSGVIQRIRLIDSREVTYTEGASLSTDLGRLRTANDGFLDEVAAFRDTYGADLVSLWIDSPNPGSCGIGYQITNPASSITSLATSGFNVVEWDCATGNYTFGHEMGHNMGANHARDDLDSNGSMPVGAYPYAHGYKQTAGATKFRTIMSYDTGCSCPRIAYWSNPSVSYAGLPAGIDPNSTQGAANYLVLNNTRTIVANYRSSVTSGGTFDAAGPQLTITSHTNGQSVSTSSITISGTATDSGSGNNGVSSVTVNGVRAGNDTATGSGTSVWNRTLALGSGANTITVVAKDNSAAQNATSSAIVVNLSTSTTSTTASTYHVFPQFADGRLSDGTFYRTTLMISNPSFTTGATCTMQLRGLTVPGFNLNYTLGLSGWVISSTSGNQEIQSGYATLQCSANVEAQLLYSFYGSNGLKISEATVFSSPPASTVKILADEREGAQVGLAIANDSDQSVTYSISISNTSGGFVTLGPRSSTAKFLNQFVSGIPPDNVAQVVVSATSGNASIIGLRFTGGVFTTIPQSMRSVIGPTAGTYHVFPQFADGRFSDGSYYKTTRMYLNPNSTATADCTTLLRGLTTDGASSFTANMSPGSTVIARSNGTQDLQTGYATLQCSASVDAQALYSYYAANGVKLSEATVFSSPSAQRVQVLADSREGSQVGLGIANDTDQAHNYTITVFDANGNTVGTANRTLNARTSIGRFLNELVTVPPNHYGQVIVSSTTGTVSIIGLRFTGAAMTTIPQTIR